METNADGTYFQEGDHVRVKRSGEQGQINAVDGGVVYVLMAVTHETKLFSAYSDEDAYIELVSAEVEETVLQERTGILQPRKPSSFPTVLLLS